MDRLLVEHGDAKLTDLLVTLAYCPKARSAACTKGARRCMIRRSREPLSNLRDLPPHLVRAGLGGYPAFFRAPGFWCLFLCTSFAGAPPAIGNRISRWAGLPLAAALPLGALAAA